MAPDVLATDGTVKSGLSQVILWGDLTRDRFGHVVIAAELGGGPAQDLVVVSSWHDAASGGRIWLFEPSL